MTDPKSKQTKTIAITEEQVRVALDEGREVGRELRRRIKRMHRIEHSDDPLALALEREYHRRAEHEAIVKRVAAERERDEVRATGETAVTFLRDECATVFKLYKEAVAERDEARAALAALRDQLARLREAANVIGGYNRHDGYGFVRHHRECRNSVTVPGCSCGMAQADSALTLALAATSAALAGRSAGVRAAEIETGVRDRDEAKHAASAPTAEPIAQVLANIEDLQSFQATDTVWGPKIRRYAFLTGASWSAMTLDERRECKTLHDELSRRGFNPGWMQAP